MPFASYNFKQFAESYGMQLVHSNPRYPQSNGLSEKTVGIVKNMMRKCRESNTDFNVAMLNYRATPVGGLDYSPSVLLMARKLRTTLPCSEKSLKPDVPKLA
ncbi:hypothetical protein PYW07_006617 [Mythimna separata]|uniref:Integrase catalytic domain-containing protein n=1 Tax=Mythimna separata TaxID=271217 RepID=A0AAD7YU00_MYTSE|nr:hypothetical protein PYW07_006617 [Mythimna separata]